MPHTLMAFLLAARVSAPGVQQPDSTVYLVTRASELAVETSKAGLFGMFGHTHRIRATSFEGRVIYVPQHPEASSVTIRLPTDSLEVVSTDTSEQRKVGANMKVDVLDVAHFPDMAFASTALKWDGRKVHMTADLTMHGQTRPVEIDAEPVITADTLRVSVRFTVKQTTFGIHPFSTAAGTVKVGDDVEFDIKLVAVRQAR
jgi:polyisoprenoid-binding protein YceI